MSPPAEPTSLAQLKPDDFEQTAGAFIEQRLRGRGPSPYSLCEARLGEADYLALQMWAEAVSPDRLTDTPGDGGLVFLTVIAEYNRRHSPGDEVWPGIAGLFHNPDTLTRMFTAAGQARQFAREMIKHTVRCFHLRHVFDESHEEAQRWYLTIQLQYGWSRAQLEQHLPDWLGGHPVPETMRRLLDPAGRYRSRSFQRLFKDLQYFRRGYLTELDLRRTLATNSWVLPDWTEDLIRWARKKGPKPDVWNEDPPDDLLETPAIEWDADGPYAVCRTRGPGPNRGDSGRYHLRHDGRLLTSWFRRPDGSYFADRDEVCLPLDSPRAVVRLEASEGECVAVQTVEFWDPTFEVQAFLPGRTLGPITILQGGAACVLMMRADYAASAAGADWCLVGHQGNQRRWVFIDEVSTDLHVKDGEGRVAWQAVVTSPPLWAGDVRVDFDADHSTLRLQDRVGFRFTTGPGVSIEYACCNGSPLQFLDPARTRTERKRVTPERAASGFHLRIGLERSGERAIFRNHISVPVQGVAVEQNGQWKPLRSDDWISTAQASTDLFRLFTNRPSYLMEGNTVHRRWGDRPRPLGRLLGTGGPIRLVDVPYSPSQDVRLAGHAIDFGAVLSFQSGNKDARLELQRAVAPRAEHQLVLWSNRHGLYRIDHDRITCENDGRVWRFEHPWTDAPDALLCGVAYEGYHLGFGWSGQWHRFFSTDPAEHPGLQALQKLALIRWFRLPGLMANKFVAGEPMLLPLAIHHAADLLAVVLFDRGLEELPTGIKLAFEESVIDREQFDVTVIELFLDYQPSLVAAEQIRQLFPEGRQEMVNRLFAFHPLLGARVLFGEWFSAIKPSARNQARQDLRHWRRTFAGIPPHGNYSDESGRRQTLREQAEQALSEGTGPGFQGMMPEIERAAFRAALHSQPLTDSNRANLLVALGSGDFRQYLGLRLLDDLENRL